MLLREKLWIYLKQWGNKLPDSLTDKQKEAKVINLLTALRKADVIARDSGNQRTANWVLFKNNIMEAKNLLVSGFLHFHCLNDCLK